MGSRVSIRHDEWDRPENIWGNSEDFHRYWYLYVEWWRSYYQRAHDRGMGTKSVAMFKAILGRQDTTVMFRHLCWVWSRPDEGWTLYVDKRGPAFHVPQGSTPEEASEAFRKFQQHVDEFFARNHITPVDGSE